MRFLWIWVSRLRLLMYRILLSSISRTSSFSSETQLWSLDSYSLSELLLEDPDGLSNASYIILSICASFYFLLYFSNTRDLDLRLLLARLSESNPAISWLIACIISRLLTLRFKFFSSILLLDFSFKCFILNINL